MSRQTHMEHFRSAKVTLGEQVILDGVEGYLACREKSGHRKEWHGFFELIDVPAMTVGVHYELTLPDGRHAEINAGEIRGADACSSHKHVIEFYVVGEVRHAGRHHHGIDRGVRRLGH